MSIPETQKVILIDSNSDSFEPIKYQEVPAPKIEAANDIIIKNIYSGVNFIEAYFRKGWYPTKFPYLLGREATGEVVAVGSDVKEFAPGDKVVYLSGATFAPYTKVTSELGQILKLDEDVTDAQLKIFGSISVKSLTAYVFADKVYKPAKDDFVLVWAAAGGVGQILTQLLSQAGANVIAIASSDDKLALTKKLGAKYTINYKTENVAEKVKEFTAGEGVAASYDSVGKSSFEASLASLAVGGILISYGNASGKLAPVDVYAHLAARSLKLTRATVTPFVAKRANFEKYYRQIIKDVTSGKIVIEEPKEYPLEQYRQVAELLESGKTSGQFVLKI